MHLKSLLAGLTLALAAAAVSAQDTVVYHFDNTVAQGLKGLRNVRNHLDTDPKARITIVTHADGVDMLMEGAKAANGTEFCDPGFGPQEPGCGVRDLRDHAEEPRPQEGAVHSGGRLHAIGRGPDCQVAEAGLRLHQALSLRDRQVVLSVPNNLLTNNLFVNRLSAHIRRSAP